MKMFILALVTLCSVNVFAAKTKEQVIQSAVQKFNRAQAKKDRKATIKAKYQSQIEKLKDAQANEMSSL